MLQLLTAALAQHIRNTRPEVTRWVTLSPLTDMAERFHLKNGLRNALQSKVNLTKLETVFKTINLLDN